ERRPALPTYGVATMPGSTTPAISMRPVMRGTTPGEILIASASTPTQRPDVATDTPPLQVVTRASTSGGRIFAIALDAQPSRSAADKLLLRTALQELDALDDALRQVERVRGGFAPSFIGLSEREAHRACVRLQARDVPCSVVAGG
ncbi:MAG: hypothetical protein AAGF30_15885, partial [Pseudomonadota bacterium]